MSKLFKSEKFKSSRFIKFNKKSAWQAKAWEKIGHTDPKNSLKRSAAAIPSSINLKWGKNSSQQIALGKMSRLEINISGLAFLPTCTYSARKNK
jgi:hypothetical protein